MKYGIWIVAATTLALGGCGGSSPAPTPTPTNSPPSFTSATAASVVENTAGTFYSATASDANGDTLTYSISGGADASAFTITSDGKLSFKVAPNYELPTDSGGDNVYNVDLSVSDGKASATLALAVTVTNSKEGIAVKRISTGLGDVVGFTVDTATRDLLVYDRDGTVYRVSGDTGARTAMGNLFQSTLAGTHRLLAMASLVGAPAAYGKGLMVEQGDTGLITIRSFNYDSLGNWFLGNALVSGTGTVSDDNTAAMTVSADHKFYIALSDGSGSGTTTTTAQDGASALGKLYRVELNPDPYAGASAIFFLTYSVGSGVHQPNGASLYNSRMLFADRGGSVADEIDAYAVADTGANFGWPYYEGTTATGSVTPAGMISPILQLLRGTGDKDVTGLVGGTPYSGSIPGIANDYVFGDKSGKVFTIPLDTLDSTGSSTLNASKVELRSADFTPDTSTLDSVVALGADSSGVLYILDSDGELYRVDQGTS